MADAPTVDPILSSELSRLNDNLAGLIVELQRSNAPAAGSAASDVGGILGTLAKRALGLSAALSFLSSQVVRFGTAITTTQNQLGVSIGQAFQFETEAIVSSVEKNLKALVNAIPMGQQVAGFFGVETAGAVPITPEEIKTFRDQFREIFGGIISTDQITKLAEKLRREGISPELFLRARRSLVTAAMGDYNKVNKLERQIVSQFQAQGLTRKDAFEFIATKSELLARAGNRFAASLTRAAAEAKKIGVDLSKVSQFGDSLVSDYETFLEKTAELGALGFDIDATALAQAAISGDEGVLQAELQRQLGGMPIESMNRVAKLALQDVLSPFGFTDIRALSAGKPAGEAGPDLTRIQETFDAFADKIGTVTLALKNLLGPLADFKNAILLAIGALGVRNLANIFRRGGPVPPTPPGAPPAPVPIPPPGAAGGLSASIAYKIETLFLNLAARLEPIFPRIANSILNAGVGVGSAIRKIPTLLQAPFLNAAVRLSSSFPRISNALLNVGAKASTLAKSGGLAGVFGGVEGFISAKTQGLSTSRAMGVGAVQGISAGTGTALGAAIGTIIAPGIGTTVGAVIGGFVGNSLGKTLNEKFPTISAIYGKFFSGLKDGFGSLKNIFAPLTKSFKDLGNAIKGLFAPMSELLKDVDAGPIGAFASALGSILGYAARFAASGIATAFDAVISGLSIVIKLMTLDFSGALDTFTGFISRFWDRIKNLVPDWMAAIPEQIGALKDRVVAAFGNIVNSVTGFFGNIIDSMVSILPNWAKRLFGIGETGKSAAPATPTAQTTQPLPAGTGYARGLYGPQAIATPQAAPVAESTKTRTVSMVVPGSANPQQLNDLLGLTPATPQVQPASALGIRRNQTTPVLPNTLAAVPFQRQIAEVAPTMSATSTIARASEPITPSAQVRNTAVTAERVNLSVAETEAPAVTANVQVNMAQLERQFAELNANVQRLAGGMVGMEIVMDGTKVGRVVANNEARAITYAPMRAARLG